MKPSEGSHITTPTAHFHPVIEDNMWVWKTLTPFCSHPRYQRLRQCLKFNDALKVQNAQCMQPMCKSYWSGERFEVVQTTQWKSSNLGWDFPSWYFLVLPGRPREVFSQRGWLVRSEVASCRRKWPSQHWNLSVWLCFSHEEYAWNSWNTHCFSYTSYMMQGTNEPMQVVCKYYQSSRIFLTNMSRKIQVKLRKHQVYWPLATVPLWKRGSACQVQISTTETKHRL